MSNTNVRLVNNNVCPTGTCTSKEEALQKLLCKYTEIPVVPSTESALTYISNLYSKAA